MSSNAFARSRPRNRQQRVPRGSSCDHPRFLQLVQELARINDLKRRQQDEAAAAASSAACQQLQSSQVNTCQPQEPADCRASGNNGRLQPLVGACGGGGVDGGRFEETRAQTSNGYRSLDNNNPSAAPAPTSALQTQQPQLINNKQHYQQHNNHHHHSSHQHQHQHQHHHHHHNSQHPNQHLHQNHQHPGCELPLVNTAGPATNIDPQHNNNGNTNTCRTSISEQVNKSAPQSLPPPPPTAGFGFSKQNLCLDQQHHPPCSGGTAASDPAADSNNLDLRQDENRSKRKRSAIDTNSGVNKKNSSSSHGSSGSIKRHKSLAEVARPLSPSFTKCPICLLDTMDRDPSFTNTCFHLFCYVCIENWTKNKATCPLCRTKFTKIIFNIKSATDYNEKTASPARRDDDDVYIADRLMLEHLSGLNANSATNRNTNSDDMQFLFENLRNPEVLMPQYFANGPMDPRTGESINPFSVVTTAATDFNTSVTHPHFAPTSYSIPPNYSIALFPSRIIPTANTAIASAYTANTSLTNINSDPSSRRISRSGRYLYSRNYDPPNIEAARVTRITNPNVNSTVPFERLHHLQQQHQHQHQPSHHQQPPPPPPSQHQQQPQQTHQPPQQQPQHQTLHHQHQHNQHRSTIDMTTRQNQRIEQLHAIANLPLPYQIQSRHYNPNVYTRRSFNNSQVDHQHLLDNLYRPTPDM